MTEPNPNIEDWERLARLLTADAVEDYLFELEEALRGLQTAANRGEEITPQHILEIRAALNHTADFNENILAPLADTEPWERLLYGVQNKRIWENLGYRPTGTEPIED